MKSRIDHAYHASQNIYDDVLTQKGILSRAYIRFFWQGTDDTAIAQRMLSWIPEHFGGRLLDVPVGTAVFTAKAWRSLDNACITCLDYSEDMLKQARERLFGLQHVTCVQGDVGHLPFADKTFDSVFSMNGFHAFPDKEAAFSETHRVLKPGGSFIACFYIRGECRRTDWLVRYVLAPKGWFTPPFHTKDELKGILDKIYQEVQLYTDGSMVAIKCTK